MSAPAPPFKRSGTSSSRGLSSKRGLSKHGLSPPDTIGRGLSGGSYISDSLLKGSKPAEPKFLAAPGSSSTHGPSPNQSPRPSMSLGSSNHSTRRGLRNHSVRSSTGAGAMIRRVSVNSMQSGSSGHSGQSSESETDGYLRTSIRLDCRPGMCREVSGLDESQASFCYDDTDDLSSMQCSSRIVEDDVSTLDMSCLDLPSIERPGHEMKMPKIPAQRATSPAPGRSPNRCSASRQSSAGYASPVVRSPEPSRMSTRVDGVSAPPLVTPPNPRRDRAASPPPGGASRFDQSNRRGSSERTRYGRSKTEPISAGEYSPPKSNANELASSSFRQEPKPAPYGRTKTDSHILERPQPPTIFERSKTDTISYAAKEPPSFHSNPRASMRQYEQQVAYSAPAPAPTRNNQRRTFEDMATLAQYVDGHSATKEQEYEMEISPGVYMNFRGPQETWRAVEDGKTVESFCLECGLELVAVYDCKCIVCSECKMVNPVFEHPPHVRAESVHGAGIGLQKDLVITRMAAAYY